MKFENYFYLYGKFYDTSVEDIPSNSNYDLIIYVNFENAFRPIASLEGFFVSDFDLTKDNKKNLFCKIKDKKDFEKKYSGKFVGFK